jgi:hypothetical protein
MRPRLRYTIYMNVQSRTQKIVAVIILVAVIAAIVYAVTRDSGEQTADPAALTPEQKQEVLESLQPKSSTGSTALTPEQKKALDTLGTNDKTAPKQSSNTEAKEKSILDSLQGK